jgi:hypothetical protein
VIALSFVVSSSGSDHREDNLASLPRRERVRLMRGHEDHLTALNPMRLAGDCNFPLAFQHLHERVERRRVFA